MAIAEVVTITLALAWLGIVAWQDLRTRQVSNWLTIPPLLLAVAWQLIHHHALPAILLIVMLLLDGIIGHRLVRVGLFTLVCAAAAILTADVVLPVVWATAYMAVCLNLAGGADAKIAMTLITRFPDGRLAGLMLGAICAGSILWWMAHQRSRQAAPIRWRRVVMLDLPTQQELEAHGAPLVDVLAAAFVAWLILR